MFSTQKRGGEEHKDRNFWGNGMTMPPKIPHIHAHLKCVFQNGIKQHVASMVFLMEQVLIIKTHQGAFENGNKHVQIWLNGNINFACKAFLFPKQVLSLVN